MKKIITRRVAIGTALGGMIAANIGLILSRYLRGPKLDEVDAYGKIDIPPDQITSALSSEEIEKAFNVLQREREMWLKFRGVAGRIDIINKTKSPGKQEPKVLANKGYVSLSLDLQSFAAGPMSLEGGTVHPVNVEMVYADTQNSDPVWRFNIAKSNTLNSEKFVGRDIESIRHAILYSLLTAPMVPMLSLSNLALARILGSWEVSRDGISSPNHEAYVFKSNGKPISDRLLPALSLADGHLVKMIPGRSAGKPYPIFSFQNHADQNGISYPTKITLSFGGHGEC